MTLLPGIPKEWYVLLRFAVAGVLMNLAGYLAYALLTFASLPPKLAMTVTYAGGTAINFILSRQWVFRSDGAGLGAAMTYGFVYLCGYGLNYIILWALVDRQGFNHLLVQALSIGVVAVFLFVALRLFVFPRNSSERAAR